MIRVYHRSDHQIRCSVFADDKKSLICRFIADFSDHLMAVHSQCFLPDWAPFFGELYRFNTRLQSFVYDHRPDSEFHDFDSIFD